MLSRRRQTAGNQGLPDVEFCLKTEAHFSLTWLWQADDGPDTHTPGFPMQRHGRQYWLKPVTAHRRA